MKFGFFDLKLNFIDEIEYDSRKIIHKHVPYR